MYKLANVTNLNCKKFLSEPLTEHDDIISENNQILEFTEHSCLLLSCSIIYTFLILKAVNFENKFFSKKILSKILLKSEFPQKMRVDYL